MIAILLDGLAFGLQLSMLAVGLTLIYGLGGVLNLAHGQFAVAGGIVGALLIGRGAGVAVGIVAALGVAALLAAIVDVSLMRPVYRLTGERRVLLSLLVTLGIAFVIEGYLFANHAAVSFNLSVPGPVVRILGVGMRRNALVAAAIAIVTLGVLIVFLRTTRLGRAIRSIIQDEDGARLVGIDPGRVRSLVFVLSGLLAGLFAVAEAFNSSVGPDRARLFTILALIVTVVGGLGSVSGALVAGLLLGVTYVTAQFLVGSFLTYVILLLAAVVIILVRPSGLLGRAH
ncbi:MAG: branched-chain amino acid ABC transporter permease [Nitriliruptoraceae bacterium]|nr:branched-chain amino acid ABC transporter permease [Nitriliruptoraceae bacterium]